ncbi:putative disease resistance RPP13-like protein 1 [Pistacia vera]|uniref:putative disease resistance RPP13-like protein 1 n=1 Tax=Pistacia vera TaxID=55513 RepID=UPI0012635DE9|nr:putative disease resistance RPP13-like protein 1 [Pistacia vera]
MAAVKNIGPEFYGSSCSLPFPSLKTLCIEDMEEWKHWTSNGTDQEMEGFPQLRYLSILRCSKLQGKLPAHLPALERLVIQEYQFTQQIPDLEEMKIVNCEEVISFWQRGIRLKQDLGFLRVLVIESCPNFTSMEADEGDGQRELWIPSGLRCLRLNGCECLVELPRALQNLRFLREISVMNCPKLVSFPPDAGLPSHLRFINIKGCDALESLPQAWICSSNMYLESMFIEECAAFTHIFKVQLPPNLKRLIIRSCNNLRTVVDEGEVSVPNTSLLEDLVISQCPNLVSLTSGGNLPKSLKYVSINECSKLESMAEGLHDNTSFECIEKILYGVVQILFPS